MPLHASTFHEHQKFHMLSISPSDNNMPGRCPATEYDRWSEASRIASPLLIEKVTCILWDVAIWYRQYADIRFQRRDIPQHAGAPNMTLPSIAMPRPRAHFTPDITPDCRLAWGYYQHSTPSNMASFSFSGWSLLIYNSHLSDDHASLHAITYSKIRFDKSVNIVWYIVIEKLYFRELP